MKTKAIAVWLGLIVSVIGNEFKALKIDYASKAKFVENLSGIKIAKVSIDKLNLSEAISSICRGNNEKGGAPIVSYVVVFPKDRIDADPFSENPVEKAKIDPLVSYEANDTKFTEVLDALCVQAKYTWSVADDSEGRSFILIEYKGEQAVRGNADPANR